MDQRIKIFGVIAVIGFIAGIIAMLIIDKVIPWLKDALPSLSKVTPYLIAGIIGAALAVIFIIIWSRTTGNRDNNYKY
jgi:H+/Cl- antiporter ClcA